MTLRHTTLIALLAMAVLAAFAAAEPLFHADDHGCEHDGGGDHCACLCHAPALIVSPDIHRIALCACPDPCHDDAPLHGILAVDDIFRPPAA